MPKVVYVPEKKLNPADELRDLLTSLEERHVKLKLMGEAQALDILRDLDRITQLFAGLQSSGLDLTPEAGRLSAVQSRLRNSAGTLLKALGGPAALRKLRPDPAPGRGERWWWYLDELVAERRRQVLRRMGLVAGIIAVLVGGVILAFKTVLAPDPITLARVEAERNAGFALETGDLRAALEAIDAGLKKAPDEPELLLFKAVLLDALGNRAEAGRLFTRARTAMADPLMFYLIRSQLELRTNRPAQAEQDIREALKINPESPKAWLLMGQALEAQNKTPEAIAAYEKASELGTIHNDEEVVVLARMALGQLRMRLMSPSVNEP